MSSIQASGLYRERESHDSLILWWKQHTEAVLEPFTSRPFLRPCDMSSRNGRRSFWLLLPIPALTPRKSPRKKTWARSIFWLPPILAAAWSQALSFNPPREKPRVPIHSFGISRHYTVQRQPCHSWTLCTVARSRAEDVLWLLFCFFLQPVKTSFGPPAQWSRLCLTEHSKQKARNVGSRVTGPRCS